MKPSTFTYLALGIGIWMLVGCASFPPGNPFAFPPHPDVRRSIDGPLTLARLAESRGEAFEAERLYRTILEHDPDNPRIHHRLGVLQAQKGRFDQANRYFAHALQYKPDDPTLLSDAGYNQYLQQRFEHAETLLHRALERDPQHEAATHNLALVLAEQGDPSAALALFRQTGSEARAYANLGFVLARNGDVEGAKTAYSRALRRDPQMTVAAEALVQLAQFQTDTERLASANPPAATEPDPPRPDDYPIQPASHRHEPAPEPVASPPTRRLPPTM